METLIGGILIFYLLMFVLGIAGFIFWLNMLIKAAKHDFEHKTPWILVIIFGQILGAIIFYFVVYREKIKPRIALRKTEHNPNL